MTLVAILVSGSLAYFTAQDAVTNAFTIGSVEIEIYENGAATPDAVKPLGQLIPIVKTATPNADANYKNKVVDVKNTGKNADGTYTSADVNILVAAQAIQADGFTGTATEALNDGFTANTNPWQQLRFLNRGRARCP